MQQNKEWIRKKIVVDIRHIQANCRKKIVGRKFAPQQYLASNPQFEETNTAISSKIAHNFVAKYGKISLEAQQGIPKS